MKRHAFNESPLLRRDTPVSLRVKPGTVPRGYARVVGDECGCALTERGHLLERLRHELGIIAKRNGIAITISKDKRSVSVEPAGDVATIIGRAVLHIETIDAWATELSRDPVDIKRPDMLEHRRKSMALNCAFAGIDLSELLGKLGWEGNDLAGAWWSSEKRRVNHRGGAGAGRRVGSTDAEIQTAYDSSFDRTHTKGGEREKAWHYEKAVEIGKLHKANGEPMTGESVRKRLPKKSPE